MTSGRVHRAVPRSRAQHGVSIVELMVAIVVGMLVVLAATGTLGFMEASKRTGMGGNGALENGVAVLALLEHDAKMAGLGFSAPGKLACPTINLFYAGTTRLDNAPFIPVAVSAGVGAPDSVTVTYADYTLAAAPSTLFLPMTTPDAEVVLENAGAIAAGGAAVLSNPGSADPCTVVSVTAVDTNPPGTIRIAHDGTGPFNPTSAAIAFAKPVAYPMNASINRADGLTWATYRIGAANRLELVNNLTGEAQLLATNAIGLKIQYGVTAAPGTTTITDWVDATGAWANPSPVQVAQIRAIRVGILLRNPQKEKPSVIGGACDATTTIPLAWPGGPSYDYVATRPDWQCYRYRSMRTTIPLKNLNWAGVT
jgi:type IV pilus assembly protein PilW